jgi:hypothetical protein
VNQYEQPGHVDLVLLSTFGNRALDGGREAVLEHLEDDTRRCRTDAVNAWQDAGIEKIGQRTFESSYSGRWRADQSRVSREAGAAPPKATGDGGVYR